MLKLKLWAPDAKDWLIGKDPVAGKDWGQEEKGTTEDEMVGWHHWLNGHAFEQAPGVGNGQGSLACCSPCGCKESATTEWLNNNTNNEHSKKEIKKTAPFTLSNRIKSLRINLINQTKWSEVRDSLVGQMVKRLPAVRETRVWSLGEEDLLEKEMATHSSVLAWIIPWMEEPGGLQSTEFYGHIVNCLCVCKYTTWSMKTIMPVKPSPPPGQSMHPPPQIASPFPTHPRLLATTDLSATTVYISTMLHK